MRGTVTVTLDVKDNDTGDICRDEYTISKTDIHLSPYTETPLFIEIVNNLANEILHANDTVKPDLMGRK